MLSGRMASPDKMFNPKNVNEYLSISEDGVTVYIEKMILSEEKTIEFLIPYFGKFKLIIKNQEFEIDR